MADIIFTVLLAVLGVTIVAAIIYIGGFLISMLVTMFTAPVDAIKHHHHPATG
jgi:hypothetical protein